MQQTTFNSLFTNIPTIGLGLAALGRPGYITLDHAKDLQTDYSVKSMQEHTNQVLDAAWENGIRYFDAARSYGRAEVFLANWLHSRNIAPSDVVVGSKWGYTYTAGWQIEAEKHEVKEHSLTILRRQWSETQTNLGDYLNLYQIHSATLETGVLDNWDVLHELSKLKETGTFIGLSLSGTNQAEVLKKALSVKIDGVALFDTVQVTWNLLETSTSEVLSQASNSGMSVIIKEVVANGRLTMRNQNLAFSATMQILEEQALRLNTTIDALAIAAALAQPWATIVLSGAARVEHLASNIKAHGVIWDEEAATTLAQITQEPAIYWQERSDLKWN